MQQEIYATHYNLCSKDKHFEVGEKVPPLDAADDQSSPGAAMDAADESLLPPLDAADDQWSLGAMLQDGAIDDDQSPPSFGVDDTINVDEPVSEESIRSDNKVAPASDAPPVRQWSVHKGASKRGKDTLVEGFFYTVDKR